MFEPMNAVGRIGDQVAPLVRGVREDALAGLVLADDRQEPAVVEPDHVDVAVVAAVGLGDDRRRLEVLAGRHR